MRRLKIATRQSQLALWQARYVQQQLALLQVESELVPMSTKGDEILDRSLNKVGGKGLFIKELEQSMLSGDTDLAVHSMKDVPAVMPSGFVLATVCEREDPLDAFVSNAYARFDDLPLGATVGTSSLRRQAQLLHCRPDLKIVSLRGNVNTRLAKLDNGDYDAIILAAAGLIRLGFANRIAERFASTRLLPAIGQGAVGIECLSEANDVVAALQALNHHPTQLQLAAERRLNQVLNGGCSVAVAGYATLESDHLQLRARVLTEDGQRVLAASGHSELTITAATDLGERLATELLEQGAAEILAAQQTS